MAGALQLMTEALGSGAFRELPDKFALERGRIVFSDRGDIHR
jgi:hypothetical protein